VNPPSVLVIGGGPVGLSAAIDAHLHGCRVLLVEPKEGVIDKACGEGLMPDAVAALARIGVHPEGRPFVGIRYLQGKLQAEAPLPGGPGLGIRRTRLHAALLTRAQSLGLDRRVDRVVAWNQTQDEAILNLSGGETLRADYVIAADGLRSPTRTALGLDRPPWGAPRIGLRRHFEVEPWTDHVEVYWGPTAEAYITPVGDNEVGLAFLTHKPAGEQSGAPFDRLLQAFPDLARRLGPPRSA
jgi:2-polyprenyl-6-methoxyphenol hydroxylase-like FAD-dependent oxidoreductase